MRAEDNAFLLVKVCHWLSPGGEERIQSVHELSPLLNSITLLLVSLIFDLTCHGIINDFIQGLPAPG